MTISWDWETIDDIASVSSGGTPNRKRSQYWGGTIPWVTTSSIDFCTIDSANEHITDEGLKHSSAKVFSKGTLLMAMYGQGVTRGKVAQLGIDAAINQACASITPNGRISSDFLFYYLQGQYAALRNIGHGGNQTNLSGQIIKTIPVPIPPEKEQGRIVAILKIWDRTVDLTERLIAAKRARRRWLMQQLLTGQRRFPGFTAPWREVHLGEFFEEFSHLNRDNRDLEPLSCSKVYGIVPQSVVFEKRVASVDIRRYKVVLRGDLVYDPMLLWDASIGFQESVDAGVISPAYCTFHFKDGTANKDYFQFLLKSHYMRHQYKVISQGTNTRRRKAPAKAFLATKVPIPESRSEQDHIVHALSLATSEIDLLINRRDAFKHQKKGLMQQLLTGKVRVKIPAGTA